jgi:hypothetical protein
MKRAINCSAVAVLLAIAGCETTKPAPPQQQVVDTFPATRSEAAMKMVDHTNTFNQDVAQMPGTSGGEHRRLLVGTLQELSIILHLANGKVESPEFTNRLAVIDNSANVASIASIPRARMEGVENESLQAAYQALAEISSRYLFDDDKLPPMVDAIGEKITTAAGTTGPMHDLDATDAFRAIQTVVQRVTDDMLARFTANAPADTTPSPAPVPAAPPTTTPATSPAPM